MSVLKKHKLSIVIPLYNKESYIERAINSVLFQHYTRFELIVVDDGSTDKSNLIVERAAKIDNRLKLIKQQNGGESKARNTGILKAKHDFICFLDADDEWHTDFLEEIISLINHFPKADIFSTNYCLVKKNKAQNPIINYFPKDWQGEIKNFYELQVRQPPFVNNSNCCIRKKILEKIEGFPILRDRVDPYLFAQLAEKSIFAFSSKCLATYYRDIPGQVTGKPNAEHYPDTRLLYELIERNKEDKERCFWMKKLIAKNQLNNAALSEKAGNMNLARELIYNPYTKMAPNKIKLCVVKALSYFPSYLNILFWKIVSIIKR